MRIDTISSQEFGIKISKPKVLKKLAKDEKCTSIKTIKTYSQYLKEYGLDLKSRK